MGMLNQLVWTEDRTLDDTLYSARLDDGSRLTVLHRKTGYEGGWFDTESGYKDVAGNFWLASGDMDVRKNDGFTVQQAIDWVKSHANTCVP